TASSLVRICRCCSSWRCGTEGSMRASTLSSSGWGSSSGRARSIRRRCARVLGVRRFVFFFSAAASEWLLALAILAAHGPLYDHYAQLLPRPEHLSTLADQQFGAGLMLDPLGPLALAAAWALKVVLSPPASGRRRTRSQHACVVAQ